MRTQCAIEAWIVVADHTLMMQTPFLLQGGAVKESVGGIVTASVGRTPLDGEPQ